MAVIDASFVLAFLLPDEPSVVVDQEFKRHHNKEIFFYSSHLLPFEVANGLLSAVLRKRISENHAFSLLRAFLKLDILYESNDYMQCLKLSLKNHLSLYDATYLELCKRKQELLFSLDKKLYHLSQSI